MATYDLKEIALKYAKKQPQMVDDMTEEAPILERLPWKPASHNLWHMAEKLSDIDGAQFVGANAPLPVLNTSSELEKIDLNVLGGYMEQAEDTIDQFGSAEAYFGDKVPAILKQAGMDTEVKLYYDNWMAKAVADGNVKNAGATSGTVYSIMVVRFDTESNIGLFDPTGFKQGSLLEKKPINNGARYHLRSQPGVLGYGMSLKGRFGWQNISDKTVCVIANIQAGSLPTSLMIDDAIADVRGTPKSTMIYCHPKCYNLAISPFKEAKLEMGMENKNYDRRLMEWLGVPILTSYNIYNGTESIIS